MTKFKKNYGPSGFARLPKAFWQIYRQELAEQKYYRKFGTLVLNQVPTSEELCSVLDEYRHGILVEHRNFKVVLRATGTPICLIGFLTSLSRLATLRHGRLEIDTRANQRLALMLELLRLEKTRIVS